MREAPAQSPAMSGIDLSLLPAPDVIEALDYETIFGEMVAAVQTGVPEAAIAAIPDFDGTIESDPAVKVLQVAAWFRLLDRARVNAAARANLVADAEGADLDNLGANLLVDRLDGEEDDAYRERIVLAPDGYSVAGPEQAYIYHARSADADVKDARAISPTPGDVTVYVMSKTGTGAASDDLVATVTAALNADTIRPLTDHVTVVSVTVVEFDFTAQIYTFEGPDPAVVLAAAIAGRDKYIAAMRKIGRDITVSALSGSMFVEGVQKIVLDMEEDLVIGDDQVAYCTSATTTHAGIAE